MSEFNTPEQLAYAKSVAIHQMTNAIKKDIQNWGRELERSTRNSFINFSVDYKSHPRPIRYYQEKQIETFVTCDVCTLEYAIFGVFAFCPDCGTHNSVQILVKNLELVEKEIGFLGTIEDLELTKHLIGDALENAVSSFDAFGRATCSAFANKSSDIDQAKDISFQNIDGAHNRVQSLYGVDITDGLKTEEWDFIVRCFQKRHLLAHKLGVIDDEYIKKAKDPQAITGRIITITVEEVLQLVGLLKIVGTNLFDNLKS